MTSPAVPSRLSYQTEGVVSKYIRRNSGGMEASPLYSTWFREQIVSEQRFERRRRQIPSRSRRSYENSEMEIESSLYHRAHNRSVLRGKRQVDCKICNLELSDWTDVTSSPTCFHLFHTRCLEFWNVKHHKSSPESSCPVCVKVDRSVTDLPPPVITYPLPLVLQNLPVDPVIETQTALKNVQIESTRLIVKDIQSVLEV